MASVFFFFFAHMRRIKALRVDIIRALGTYVTKRCRFVSYIRYGIEEDSGRNNAQPLLLSIVQNRSLFPLYGSTICMI